MTEDAIIQFVTTLPDVVVFTASEADGSPEVAWGDSFVYFDPDGAALDARGMPFATIVTGDYDGFDTASDLNRRGVFRLNIDVGPTAFHDLVGYRTTEHTAHEADWAYDAVDRLMPHPVYARQGWVAIVNPGDATSEQVRSLLRDAHDRAVSRHRPRR